MVVLLLLSLLHVVSHIPRGLRLLSYRRHKSRQATTG
jgi:hypothetical protein